MSSSMKFKPNGWNEEFDPSWQLSFGFFNIQDEKKSPLQLEVTLMGFLVTNPWPCFKFIVVCCICEKKNCFGQPYVVYKHQEQIKFVF